jgi:cellulose synthase/poly-beta-1,6-N-acetylglucosamine synthase-like glycosyltransferase
VCSSQPIWKLWRREESARPGNRTGASKAKGRDWWTFYCAFHVAYVATYIVTKHKLLLSQLWKYLWQRQLVFYSNITYCVWWVVISVEGSGRGLFWRYAFVLSERKASVIKTFSWRTRGESEWPNVCKGRPWNTAYTEWGLEMWVSEVGMFSDGWFTLRPSQPSYICF